MSYLPRRTVSPLRHRTAQKSAFQRRVVLQGVQGGAGGILLLKQAKQCAAAAREQDARSLMLQQQLPRRGKLPALLLGAELLKDVLQRAGNLRDASCLQGLYHFLHLGVAVGLAVTAGKGRAGADAKAGLDDKDGAVRHRRQRGKLLPNPSGAQRAAPQAEGDVRPAGQRDFFKLLERQVCAGQQIESAQHGGPVGAAAPQPRHHRDALDKLDGKVVPLKRTAALPEEGAGTADGDVVLSAGEIFAGEIFAGERDSVIRLKTAAHLNLAAARLQLKGNGVAQADRLHHHVHLMVAVWQLPHNVQ